MIHEQPTAEDFAALDERSRDEEAMDGDTLRTFMNQYHAELPQPYAQAVHELGLTDRGIVRALHQAVREDVDLPLEAKHALNFEISERAGRAWMALAPEGWND